MKQNTQVKSKSRTSRFFHSQVNHLVASQVSKGSSIIDIGSSVGSTLAACQPFCGVGIESNAQLVERISISDDKIKFICNSVEQISESPITNPDYIIMSLLLDEVADVSAVLTNVSGWCSSSTRLVVVTYNRIWRPLLSLAELLRMKSTGTLENYVPFDQVVNLFELAGFEITRSTDGVLLPLYIPLLSKVLNRWIAPLPGIRHLCLVKVTTIRKVSREPRVPESLSIVVAARNEQGNITEIIRRVPQLAARQELIFVEGGSSDGTWLEIQTAIRNYNGNPSQKIFALQQQGKGKGDAVRCGFEVATGEVLMILDADLSVMPEELFKFVDAISQDRCEFANGSRLVYPMDNYAMRFLNVVGNKFFALLFKYLLGQPVGDTLCGTKVLRKSDYDRIMSNRTEICDFDPFGDFDLLFGASKLGLRIRDIPIHYKERTYGETNISRFSHGLLLIKMCRVAAIKLKFMG